MTQSLPLKEIERIQSLTNIDIDYGALEHKFKHLLDLAATIAGKEVVLINLIDSHTQWTIAQHGINTTSIPREESICRYTIESSDCFEVSDLKQDIRFKDSPYVKDELEIKYYFGIPLEISKGLNIGSLCFMSRDNKPLDHSKIELLKLIAFEIVEKLKYLEEINTIKDKLAETIKMERKIVHDLRNPLAGIIGISDILIEPDEHHDPKEVFECLKLINNSSKTMLEISDKIAIDLFENDKEEQSFNLDTLSERINKIYLPLSQNKHVNFEVIIDESKTHILFSKRRILQIIRSIVSNALKSSKGGAQLSVNLGLSVQSDRNILQIQVSSNSLSEEYNSENTTMDLTKRLITSLDGSFEFKCNKSEGLTYKINLPELS